MKLKLALATLLIPLSTAFSQELQESIKEVYNEYTSLETKLTIYQIENLGLNLKKKQIKYPLGRSTLYLNLKEWNGKPLYLLTYRFYLEDVPSLVKRLRGASSGRADEETENHSGKHGNNPASVGYWLRNWNIN